MAMQTIKGDIFDGICVAHHFSFMCCVVFVCCLCLRPVCPKLQVSLDCPFLIAPSVLSLTFIYREQMHLIKCCISIILLRTNKFGQIWVLFVNKFLLTINLLRHLSGFSSILVTVVTSGMRTVDDPKVTKADGMNILGLVVFSIFFGCTLSRMGPSGKPLADLFECMHIATMKIVTLIIWYSKSKMNCYDIHYMNALLSSQLKQNIWNLLHQRHDYDVTL